MAKAKEVSPEVENLLSSEAEGVPEEPAKEEVKEEKAENAAESAPKDDGRVECVVPMNVFGNGEHINVTSKGKTFQLETGVPLRVPKGVKSIVDEAIRRKRIAAGKMRELAKTAKEV